MKKRKGPTRLLDELILHDLKGKLFFNQQLRKPS